MTPQEEFAELQAEVESLKRDLGRAEGAAEQTMKALAEHNCKTVKEGHALLKRMEEERAKMREAYEASLQEYEDAKAARAET